MKSLKKLILPLILASCSLTSLTGCDSPLIFINGGGNGGSYVPFKDTKNAIFFALYNYYGQEGQNFTNRWLGMRDALDNHGITVTNWEAEKDARKFVITREADCDLPEDAKIYMVNNQTWDVGLQLTKPLNNYKPMAVISTCNGVEFCSAQILAHSPGTQNATMGGFSAQYRDAFAKNSLSYLAAKFSTHVAPIFAAGVHAVRGNSLRYNDGSALRLRVGYFDITSLEQYDEIQKIDNYTDNPTIKKADVEPFFTKGNASYGADLLTEWCIKSSVEDYKAIYDNNRDVVDKVSTDAKIKVGLVVPGSINDTVQAYVDYFSGYLAKVYNVEMLVNESVTSSNDQSKAAIALCNQGAQLIISLQDDTNRNAAIKVANERGVYFASAGSSQNDKDYAEVKDLPYFVGSCGSAIEDEREATRKMTEYYLDAMIERNK